MKYSSYGMSGLLAMVGLLILVVGCGGDDGPTPLVINECGGEGSLSYEGSVVTLGDACGVCGRGSLVCGGGGVICEDPNPDNGCGGCGELEGEPGAFCPLDDGASGVWSCVGENEVSCEPGERNGCGGESELAAQPGDACGECMLDEYVCNGLEATVCEASVGCPGAQEVQATQGTRADGVNVSWRGDVRATGYRVYRGGQQVADLPAGSLSYLDEDTAAVEGTQLSLTASGDRGDGVELEWALEADEAESYSYQVMVIYEAGSSSRSESVTGYRGLSVERYELAVDGGSWVDVGDQTSYVDEEAPVSEEQSIEVVFDERQWDRVLVELEAFVAYPAQREYAVRAVLAGGDVTDSSTATGVRSLGDLEIRLERSDLDAPQDWEELAQCSVAVTCEVDGCGGAAQCEDDGFVGDILERNYRYIVSSEAMSAPYEEVGVYGVALLVPEPEAVAAEVEIGEEVEFAVQLVDGHGDAVAREGVELTIEVSDLDAVAGILPKAVLTDAEGRASVVVSFEQAAVDFVVSWTAEEDLRVSDETVSHPPVTVVADEVSPLLSTVIVRAMSGEVLADGVDFLQVDIELRTEANEPVALAPFVLSVDGTGVEGLDCDEMTDAAGMASCVFAASEPGLRTVRLESPVEVVVEEVGPFYATVEHYPQVVGDLRDIAVIGDYVVFAGEDLSDGEDTLGGAVSALVVDRISGEVLGELDAEAGDFSTLVVDGGELFAAGADLVGRYVVGGAGLERAAYMNPFYLGARGLLAVDEDWVVVSEESDEELLVAERDQLLLLPPGPVGELGNHGQAYVDVQIFEGVVYGLLGEVVGPTLPAESYVFSFFTLPHFAGDAYLEATDIQGDVGYFAIGEGGDHFLAGDFTEVRGEAREGLAKLTADMQSTSFEVLAGFEVAGGLFVSDGLVYSAGLWAADRGEGETVEGRSFDAVTGALGPYDLGNLYAWEKIRQGPRHFFFVSPVEGITPVNYEMVLRPDVAAPVVE